MAKLTADAIRGLCQGFTEKTSLNVSLANKGADASTAVSLKATVVKQINANDASKCSLLVKFAGHDSEQTHALPDTTAYDYYVLERFVIEPVNILSVPLRILDPTTYAHSLTKPSAKDFFMNSLDAEFHRLRDKYHLSFVPENRDSVDYAATRTLLQSLFLTIISMNKVPDTLYPAFNAALQSMCRLHIRLQSEDEKGGSAKINARLSEFTKLESERLPNDAMGAYDVTTTVKDSLEAAMKK